MNDTLEDVARDMYVYIDGVLNKNWAFDMPNDIDTFYRRLKKLGVDFDSVEK